MRKLLVLLHVLAFVSLYSQKQASNWYFGDDAGINFDLDTGAVTPVTNGVMGTVEGCTTISSPDGDLLFYTDGSTVFNANHAEMLNGFGLLGDASSSQSAIVVPKPNDPDIYYIFTVGSNQNRTGLTYSEVDMTLDGGLGGITIKNTRLLDQCAEKVSAVLKDCESATLWVIALSNILGSSPFQMDSFHAFEVNDTGVNNTAIVSTIAVNINDSRGNLKFSPSGDKLACATPNSGLFIADFDAQTGIVSNNQEILIQHSVSTKPYGVAFSPNSELLYVTASNDFFSNGTADEDPAAHQSLLIQYNLLDLDISNSQIILDDRQLYRGGLQLGPNGKIYRALSYTYDIGSPFLGVINNPNTLGIGCNYQHDAINLGGKLSRQGLPPFVQSFFTEKTDIIQDGNDTLDLELCEGESYILIGQNIQDATYTWTKDGILLPETDFDLEIFENGIYKVLIEITNGECGIIEGTANVNYVENPEAFNTTLAACDEDAILDGLTTFNLTEANEELVGGVLDLTTQFYTSQNDAENGSNEIIDPTSYNNISDPETLYVRVARDNTGCVDYSELTLFANSTQFDDNEIVYYCLNYYPDTITLESNLIVQAGDTYSYSWSTGETTPTIDINSIGSYTVTITNNTTGCTTANTIIVEPSNIATIDDITIVDGAISNNTVTIFASGEGTYTYALFDETGVAIHPYQENHVFNSVFPGIYTVAVKDIKNDCGTVEALISVIGFPKFFTPNGDGINDTWQVYGINDQFQPNTTIYIFDRYGKILKQVSPSDKGWDGRYNGSILPTDDYWFYVILEDGRTFRNHFTLKR